MLKCLQKIFEAPNTRQKLAEGWQVEYNREQNAIIIYNEKSGCVNEKLSMLDFSLTRIQKLIMDHYGVDT